MPAHLPPPVFAGYGLGLRREHYRDFLETRVPVDFVEVISENFMVAGGQPLDILRRVRARHPVALHGVSLSVGSADGLRGDCLTRLRALVDGVWSLYAHALTRCGPVATMIERDAGIPPLADLHELAWLEWALATAFVARDTVRARAEHGFDAPCALLVERLGADDGVAQAGALLADWIGSELLARVSGPRQP
jgi:uncharacterized protein (UPF0276 family)